MVHKDDCPFLQGDDRIYLGLFLSEFDALKAAKNYYSALEPCRFCLKASSQSEDTFKKQKSGGIFKGLRLPGIIILVTSSAEYSGASHSCVLQQISEYGCTEK